MAKSSNDWGHGEEVKFGAICTQICLFAMRKFYLSKNACLLILRENVVQF